MRKRSEHRYYHVSPKVWEHAWDEDTRYLAFYILTCRHRTVEGLFKLPKSYAMEDVGWTGRRFERAWANLLEEDFIRYDEANKVVLIVKALEYQKPENPNQITAALRKIDEVPNTPLLADLQQIAERFAQVFAQHLAQRLHQPLPQQMLQPPTPAPAPTPTPAPGGQRARAREGQAGAPPDGGAAAPSPDGEAEATAASVYHAMDVAGVAPASRSWRDRAAKAVATLTPEAQTVAADAVTWVLGLADEGERQYLVGRLSATDFGPVIDAYNAGHAQPKASSNGHTRLTAEQWREQREIRANAGAPQSELEHYDRKIQEAEARERG